MSANGCFQWNTISSESQCLVNHHFWQTQFLVNHCFKKTVISSEHVRVNQRKPPWCSIFLLHQATTPSEPPSSSKPPCCRKLPPLDYAFLFLNYNILMNHRICLTHNTVFCRIAAFWLIVACHQSHHSGAIFHHAAMLQEITTFRVSICFLELRHFYGWRHLFKLQLFVELLQFN
jgi:hypothetical protein